MKYRSGCQVARISIFVLTGMKYTLEKSDGFLGSGFFTSLCQTRRSIGEKWLKFADF